MIIRNVAREDILQAALSVGVVAEVSAKGRGFNVKVGPTHEKNANGDRRYQRVNHHDRRIAAVCWHGFRDFFRAIFKSSPDAEIRTALTTYRGRDHFEETYPYTGHINIGSQMKPMMMADACRCPDSGRCL